MKSNSVLSFLDRLGHKPELFINDNERDTSYLGAFTTILISIGVLIVVLFYFIEFLLGSGMTVVSSQDNVSQPILYDYTNKLFMVRILDTRGNSVDPLLLHLHANLLTYREMNVTFKDISLSKCSNDIHTNIAQFNFSNINISQFYCIDPNQDVDVLLTYDEMNNTGSYMTLYVTKCTNDTDIHNCLPKEEIDSALKSSTYFLTYNIANTKVNHFNASSPFSESYYSNFIQLYPDIKYDYTQYYKYVEYKSDKGWLISSWKTFTEFQFDESLTEKVAHIGSQDYLYPNALGSFVFWVSSSMINKHERTYPKIQSMIVNVSSLSKVLIVVGELIVKFFTKGSYYVSLYFAVQLKCESNKPTISLSRETGRTKTVYYYKSNRVNPCVSFQWHVLPKLNTKTLNVELYKNRIAEYLSVENIIHRLFANEIKARYLIEKKEDTGNTSHSIMTSQQQQPHLIKANLLNVKHLQRQKDNDVNNKPNTIGLMYPK